MRVYATAYSPTSARSRKSRREDQVGVVDDQTEERMTYQGQGAPGQLAHARTVPSEPDAKPVIAQPKHEPTHAHGIAGELGEGDHVKVIRASDHEQDDRDHQTLAEYTSDPHWSRVLESQMDPPCAGGDRQKGERIERDDPPFGIGKEDRRRDGRDGEHHAPRAPSVLRGRPPRAIGRLRARPQRAESPTFRPRSRPTVGGTA